MDDATIVFNGTFSMPAGLISGDWVEIPLTTPFAYNPTKNLVVQMASDPAGSAHTCLIEADATLYLDRHMSTGNRTNATGVPNDFLADLRLWFSE